MLALNDPLFYLQVLHSVISVLRVLRGIVLDLSGPSSDPVLWIFPTGLLPTTIITLPDPSFLVQIVPIVYFPIVPVRIITFSTLFLLEFPSSTFPPKSPFPFPMVWLDQPFIASFRRILAL